jgi:hypothetical protein
LSGLFDLVLELVFRMLGITRGTSGRIPPLFTAIALLVFGGLAGGATTWLFPRHLLGTPLVPGASLVISPLVNGALMHFYGAWHTRHQRDRSFAATFWGGALFAFGFALVRFLTVTGP